MVLVELPASVVPWAILGLEPFKLRHVWSSDADFAAGYNAICDFQIRLLQDMSEAIVSAIDRVYMAVRQLSVGEVFTAGIGDTPPALPVVPPGLPDETITGLLGQLYELRGLTPGGWFGIGAEPVTLSDVVKALRQGSEAEATSLLDRLDLLGDAGDISGIFNTVRNTITDGLEVGAEGGVLATLVVSTMAQTATAGLLAAQIDTLLAKLDRVIEQVGVPVAPAPDATLAGELATIRDNLTP
jgi:hypothetical protein